MGLELSEQQGRVITALLAGETRAEAARKAGVAEATVREWKREDAAFVAALNARREEAWEAASQRLRNMADKAVRVYESALDSDNEKIRLQAARQVLKTLELDTVRARTGPADPDKVARDWEEREAWEALTSFS